MAFGTWASGESPDLTLRKAKDLAAKIKAMRANPSTTVQEARAALEAVRTMPRLPLEERALDEELRNYSMTAPGFIASLSKYPALKTDAEAAMEAARRFPTEKTINSAKRLIAPLSKMGIGKPLFEKLSKQLAALKPSTTEGMTVTKAKKLATDQDRFAGILKGEVDPRMEGSNEKVWRAHLGNGSKNHRTTYTDFGVKDAQGRPVGVLITTFEMADDREDRWGVEPADARYGKKFGPTKSGVATYFKSASERDRAASAYVEKARARAAKLGGSDGAR